VTRIVPGHSPSLRRFQDAFAEALLAPAAPDGAPFAGPPAVARLVAQPGFAVYRNTVLKGCIDALQANYPAVSRLVGDAWFRAAAAVYVPAALPRQPSLLDYGDGFADFLAHFEPARELPYLAGVARLDRFWTEAHVARDEVPLAAAAVARLPPEELARVVLRPHASARWAWFDGQPIRSIWQSNRPHEPAVEGGVDATGAYAWQGEGALVVRPRAEVAWLPLDQAGCAFLDACAAGRTLTAAAAAALAADAHADLAALMAHTLAAGAFGGMALNPATRPEHER